jgi:hypothetical protein
MLMSLLTPSFAVNCRRISNPHFTRVQFKQVFKHIMNGAKHSGPNARSAVHVALDTVNNRGQATSMYHT